MKKYEAPEVKVVRSELLSFICVSGKRSGDWGGNDPSNPYINPDYHNEGYNEGGENIDDDYGELDAT